MIEIEWRLIMRRRHDHRIAIILCSRLCGLLRNALARDDKQHSQHCGRQRFHDFLDYVINRRLAITMVEWMQIPGFAMHIGNTVLMRWNVEIVFKCPGQRLL
ncbi:hypothetical protein CKO_01554 [Citrobacter koseri ATCC BAA-895]|uniref:Uncharacterized protein n=1 Tax=Citrobacter koseri (strain ATCC BAA-895 / CDC 4225-83 / SGSC4696) TaxID=290338 RepID=A8AGS2_CITK8|nr:hypothetical protein CKO_01554 [Citrobacter koseri ATCC BAA-895]